MNGAQAFVEVLRREGVTTMFGLPGSTEASLLEAIRADGGIAYVLALHEGVAVSMADGYGRVSGLPGVVGLHTSVGTMNGLSQAYNAQRDGAALVVTAGDKDRAVLSEGGFCAVADLASLPRGVLKWSHQSLSARALPGDLARALQSARTPPQGAAFLSVPEDLFAEELGDDGPRATAPLGTSTRLVAVPDPAAVAAASEAMRTAERPLLVAGSQAAHARSELVATAAAYELPVAAAEFADLAEVAYPLCDPRYIGLFREERAALEGCDLVVAVGCRVFYPFSDASRPVLPPGARVVQAHVDPAEIGRTERVEVGLVGDEAETLRALVRALEEAGGLPGAVRSARAARLAALTEARDAAKGKEMAQASTTAPIDLAQVGAALSASLPADAIVVDESVRSSRLLLRHMALPDTAKVLRSAGGALGWGTPAAVGAKLAAPSRPVVAVVGDGSFHFSVQAIWSAVAASAPLVVVVLDNGGYLAVKRAVEGFVGLGHDPRRHPGTEITGIDHVAVAEGYGARGRRVGDAAELADAVAAGLETEQVTVVHVPVVQVRP